ncbi:MAG: sensor histidine kinase, partial [Filifactoraceae bacterium]
NKQIIKDLQFDATQIVNEIEDSIIIYNKMQAPWNKDIVLKDILTDRKMFYYTSRLATTNVIVLNESREVIFSSLNIDNGGFIDPTKLSKNKFFVLEQPIKNKKTDEVLGTLIAFAQKENLDIINKLINNAGILGFTISVFVALVLSLFFERNITEPIKKLRDNVSMFSIESESSWISVDSNDEINDLNNEFKKMTEKLISYNERQKEFFQNTSHELKTPLMSINGYAEAIKDEIIPPEDINVTMDIIIDETRRLTETVNSIVYLSKLDNMELQDLIIPERLDLSEFILEIVNRFKPVALEREIQLIGLIDKDIFVYMKDEHLYKITSNLITNALRYANSCVEVILTIDLSGLKISVIDDGVGFELEDLERAFERFYKGNKGNTGLGLAIVKSTAKTYDGRVLASNNLNGGAKVEVIFPISSWIDYNEREKD